MEGDEENIISSPNECSESYRGPAPFSEEETKTIKRLVDTEKFDLAMNLHCYGNMWVIPTENSTYLKAN